MHQFTKKKKKKLHQIKLYNSVQYQLHRNFHVGAPQLNPIPVAEFSCMAEQVEHNFPPKAPNGSTWFHSSVPIWSPLGTFIQPPVRPCTIGSCLGSQWEALDLIYMDQTMVRTCIGTICSCLIDSQLKHLVACRSNSYIYRRVYCKSKSDYGVDETSLPVHV